MVKMAPFVLMRNVYVLMAGLVMHVMKVCINCIMVMSYIFIAICSSGCLMGDCTEPDTCVCDPGWTGQTCNTGE